jgi:hypothetical protein
MRVSSALFLLLVSCDSKPAAPPPKETLTQFEARIDASPKPSAALIESIEHQLARNPCIGSLSNWNRQYAYGLPTRQVDETRIDFLLKKAGRFGVVSGRLIVNPGATLGIDDTPVKMVWGTFDRKTQVMKVEFCGDNFSKQTAS